MSEETQGTEITTAKVPLVTIDITTDSVIGYASIQNDVPVIRTLVLTNNSEVALEGVELRITCAPGFAEGSRHLFDHIAPGESRSLGIVDLKPNHEYLANLSEAVKAHILVGAFIKDEKLSVINHPIKVLAYDQWAGMQSLPELLAAFSLPNAPVVDTLIARASRLLREKHPNLSMNGYDSHQREAVWNQISSIYSTLAACDIQYALPPASFGVSGQKIRTPDRVLEGGLGTCLDLTMLFVSCLEQAGLNTVVLFKEGHAWVGCWLIPNSFSNPVIDDVLSVRKRVQSGELLVFETTVIAQAQKSSLRSAMALGANHLDEEGTFRYGIDIKRSRELRILPLPSREQRISRAAVHEEAPAPSVEDMPELPPLDVLSLPLTQENSQEETPDGRLAKWKSRLLDLSLRNRLLNFKPTKSNLKLIVPDINLLEDKLSEGKEFRLRALPKMMEGNDPRSASVHIARTTQRPLEEVAREALGRNELLAAVEDGSLDGRLLEIFNQAKTGLEEGGANVLYVALGMLSWRDEENAQSSHLAPLLLIPVTLTRKSVRSGFVLTRHDDEIIVNPTLLQLLRQNFDLMIDGLSPLPADAKGVDVLKVLQIFRLAINEIQGWEVTSQVYLGIFSFTKYLMWKDLQDRVQALTQNRVVAHLVNNPGRAFANEEVDFDPRRLDETYRPQDVFAPLLLDSSQLTALCVASAGHDLVVEGPPGTGKSQTITNLIAHFLATDKTVLFVSEKMAALEVVHRRLSRIGLGPFCLELHSAKASKADVVHQLGQALDFRATRTSEEWEREAERLAALRQELNALVVALHHIHPNGLTVYDALGSVIKHRQWPECNFDWSDADAHDHAGLDGLRLTSRTLATAAEQVREIETHPLSAVQHADWSPGWQADLVDAAEQLEKRSATLAIAAEPLTKLLGIPPVGQSASRLLAIDRLADVLLAAPTVPLAMAKRAADASVRSKVEQLRRHGELRQKYWRGLDQRYMTSVVQLNVDDLSTAWQTATSAWWPKSWFAKRAVTGRLKSFAKNQRPPLDADVAGDLAQLQQVSKEDATLAEMRVDAEALLQSSYSGAETDWEAVKRHESWAQSYIDALAGMAGTDAATLEALDKRLQPLVGDDRALLAGNAAVGKVLYEYRDACRTFLDALSRAQQVSGCTEGLAGDQQAAGILPRIQSTCQAWRLHSRQLQSWCLWRKARNRAISQGLAAFVASIENGQVQLQQIVAYFEYAFRAWWLKKCFDREPVLKGFASVDHARKIHEFCEADGRFQRLTEQYVVARLASRVPASTSITPSADSEIGRIRRELQRQRGHSPVRQLIHGMPTLLPRLKPCLLMSPLSVAQYLAANHQAFDVVIFDEASQIPVWDAVGAIARGKQLIVVGDPKQLPPTNFFMKATEDEEQADDDEVQDLESILDECLGAGLRTFRLKWHYRSRHESLITFSNLNYYDGELITFPSPATLDRGVQFNPIRGVYERGSSRTNRAEAEAIVSAIEKHFIDEHTRAKSVGVVTFNQPQQNLIQTLLDERRRKNTVLDSVISESTFEPLFVKNLENVQGDERDYIFFSITYGQDAAGRMPMNFGPLNLEGGQRRLNVAISRAREGVQIFSSLSPDQIDLSRVRARGVIDLKNYLDFAIRGPRALVEQSNPTGLEPDSPFEEAVIAVLRDKGWQVHSQVGCSGYRVDIGVVDPKSPGRYLLGIECDGKTYHSAATARDRDRLRQVILEGLGWKIHRIWSTDWWIDPEREIAKLLERIESLAVQEEATYAISTESEVGDPALTIIASAQIVNATFDKQDGTQSLPQNPEATSSREESVVPFQKNTYVSVATKTYEGQDFHGREATEPLKTQLVLMIENEGPIADVELFRRIARAWGMTRTGSRIVDRLQSLVPASIPRTKDGDVTFYWPSNSIPKEYGSFRVGGVSEDSRRNVSVIAIQEISNIALYALTEFGSMPSSELIRSTCKLAGMNRSTAEAEQRVMRAVRALERAGKVVNESGRLRITIS